ncbi:MAG: S-layer homology domain-containing protein, partial [Aphanizomenon sp.]
MNPINLSWSKLLVTAVSVVVLSPISSALAVLRISSPVTSKFSNSPQTQLLVSQSDGKAID